MQSTSMTTKDSLNKAHSMRQKQTCISNGAPKDESLEFFESVLQTAFRYRMMLNGKGITDGIVYNVNNDGRDPDSHDPQP